jgi:hypothetical protein
MTPELDFNPVAGLVIINNITDLDSKIHKISSFLSEIDTHVGKIGKF